MRTLTFWKTLRLPAVIVLVSGLAGGCPSEIGETYSPREWRDLFASAGGWTPLPIPDSKYRPGSIIQVTEEGVRWIDHLASCRYPADLLTPEQGRIPTINFSKDKVFGADVLLNYQGIKAGPGYNSVNKVLLRVSDHSADALRLLALRIWQEDPANRDLVSPVCMEELEKPNVYLVTESFTVSKGTYSLYDEHEAKLAVTLPMLGSMLSVEGNVNVDLTTEGDLQIDAPSVFAIRKAVRMAGDFTVLGEPGDPPTTADDEIAALYLAAEEEE